VITSTGLSPNPITIAVGATVTFANNDAVNHDVQGGPDPDHRDCPEIDAVGFLTPGQSRQTQPFIQARTCEFHDHGFHSPLFNGRIVIQ
jgi:plastocyanin